MKWIISKKVHVGCPYELCEQGSRDWRMLPAAATGWVTVLIIHTVIHPAHPDRLRKIWLDGSEYFPSQVASYWIYLTGLVLLILLCLLVPTLIAHKRGNEGKSIPSQREPEETSRHMTGRIRHLFLVLACHLPAIMVMAVTLMAVALSTLAAEIKRDTGPLNQKALEGKTLLLAEGRAATPMVVSERLGWDCRVRLILRFTLIQGVGVPTDETVLLYAKKSNCQIQQDGIYQVRGHVSLATFGSEPLWIEANDASIVELNPPRPPYRLVHRMQEAFLAQTRKLHDQGRVLVPGLTMGVLGSDSMVPAQDGHLQQEPVVEPVFAAQLKENFRQSGILHLMAVSGGHFMILAVGLKRLMRRLFCPPLITWILLSSFLIGLGILMVPSDSVMRAEVMGLMAALATVWSRRSQSISLLSWCLLLLLIYKPIGTLSYGFSLSVTAVLGMSFWTRSLAEWLEGHMPLLVSRPLAATLGAQMGTLPIQILMSPQIPLCSPLANLIVAPFVDMATITGLMSLSTSWLLPDIGFALAWVTSLGTGIMELAARWLGGSDRGLLDWPSGGVGCILMILTEVVILLFIRMIRITSRLLTDPDNVGHSGAGRSLRLSTWFKVSRWFKQTWDLISLQEFTRTEPDSKDQ